ncbi:unnamed protein product [Spirodela intermedia]|uniref:TFIIB-type domain-containing protein n=2 Tax=Spirodela intermedia TaxID=51605 RepID=A0A7I8IUS7_SPIIN|nr:unnamed protein product [Spirodela intermedia]CAA6661756.1 unnamed protein product [Spirodela intermedia]CAA7398126.1 unnamed protein product [Spirodela intermedia]
MEADFFCQECKAFTQTVLDRSTGDTVCTECALVVDHHYVDLTSEWRVFADDTDGEDKVRVGGASNPLLGDEGGLAPTLISKTNGKPTLFSTLGLLFRIQHRAQEIYKNLKDRKSIVGKPQTAVLAACLFVACRLEHAPRTVNEIFSVANGATKKKIGQAINIIEAEMGSTLEMGTARAGDFMRRFCSHLGMSNQTVKAALEAVQNSEELDIRRAPLSVAAAVIYMITQLSDEKKQLRDISLATGVAEGTIKKAYKDLYPHAAKLIPSSFAPEEDLRKLSSP